MEWNGMTGISSMSVGMCVMCVKGMMYVMCVKSVICGTCIKRL